MASTQIDRETVEGRLDQLEQALSAAEQTRDGLSKELKELEKRLAHERGPGRPPLGPWDRRIRDLLRAIEKKGQALARTEKHIAELQADLGLTREQLLLLDGGVVTDPQVLVAAADKLHPFVCLPSEIQTRFAMAPGDRIVLKVRMFPADIHAQAHVPTLQPAEEELKELFIELVTPNDGSTGDEAGAIRTLLENAPITRGAWIARTALGSVPPVPDPPPRSVGWASLLPQRWVVTVRRGSATPNTVISGPVTDEAARLVLEPDEGTTEISAEWLRDFDSAKAVGMAVDVPLGSREEIEGTELDVVVLGVDHVSSATAATESLRQALNGHMFGAGLRLLPQGTPTNNTTEGRAKVNALDESVLHDLIWPPAYPTQSQTDAQALERALGLRSGDLASIARPESGRFLEGDRNAAAMATALWAVAQGYAGQEITGVPPPYGHFTRYVRARGPLPVIAVGAMPYGIAVCGASGQVPHNDLGRRVVADSPFYDKGPWQRALAATPTVPSGLVGPETFLEMIKLTPSSRSFRMRMIKETGRFINAVPLDRLSLSARPYLAAHSWLPGMGVAERAPVWRRGLVTDRGPQPTPHGSYISAIADSLSELISQASSDEWDPPPALPDPVATSEALLYHLLRYGAALTAKWAGLLTTPMPKKSPFLTYLTEAYELQPGQLALHGNLSTVRSWLKTSAGLEVPRHGIDVAHELADEDESAPPPRPAPSDSDLLPPGVGDIFRTRDHTVLPRREEAAEPGADESLEASHDPVMAPIPDAVLDRRLDRPPITPPTPRPEPVDSIDVDPGKRATELVDALRQLAALDEPEVERLMTETLDATAYRRDAWMSSVHTRHLSLLRDKHPEGSYIGAYSFVLGLRLEREPIPATGPATQTDEPGTSGGFIAAQSLDQASTLAVLRNAYLTHAQDEDSAEVLRLNLDSRRVRIGKDLIDAVRNGNPPADVIGARLERLIHRRNQQLLEDGVVTPADGLDRHILGLRRLFPHRPSGTSSDESDFRVVNGVALVEAWRERTESGPPQSSRVLINYMNALSPQETGELGRVLDELEAQVDAADDLLTFDAAFRTIRGDRAAATRTLDAHSGIAPPPELVAIETPASGAGFSHRIMAPLTANGVDGWSGRNNLRPTLSPELNSWLETLLGDPRRIRWGYQTDGDPIVMDLSDVESLSAVDLVWTAEKWARAIQSNDANEAALVEVTQHLRVSAGADARHPDFQFLFSPTQLGLDPGSSDVTLPECGELCIRLARTIRSSRPLEAADLLPAGAESLHPPDINTAGTRARAAVNILRRTADQLTSHLAHLNAATTGDQLEIEAAESVVREVVTANGAGATIDPLNPRRLTSPANFADYVASVVSNLERLRGTADSVDQTLSTAGNEEVSVDTLREAVSELAGRDYPLIIPFGLGETEAAALKSSRDELATAVGESHRRSWVQQAARVSQLLSDYELALLLSNALGVGDAYSVSIAQLPWKTGEPWIGAELSLDDDNPIRATTSIVSFGPASVPDNDPVTGLLLDVINDRVPAGEQTGGLAFPFDQPSARAPQAIVIAVAPDVETVLARTDDNEPEPTWRWEDLLGSIDFLIEETRLRAADPNYLQGLSLSLPSTMIPHDPSSPVFRTDLVDLAPMEFSE